MTSPDDPQRSGQPWQAPPGDGPPPGYGAPPGHGPVAYSGPPPYGGPQQYEYAQLQQPNQGHPTAGSTAVLPEWWERFVARVVDGVIFLVVAYGLAWVLMSFAGSLSAAIALGALGYLIGHLLYAGYDYYMHSTRGQTIGKIVTRTRLVAADGGKPDRTALIRRSLLYPGAVAVVVLLLNLNSPLGQLLGFAIGVLVVVDVVFILTDPQRRALHDQWTGTMVVKT